MSANKWPLQSECDAFYGNPRGDAGAVSPVWYRTNMTRIAAPFDITFAGKRVQTISIHRKCADSLSRILQGIWVASGHNQAVIETWGMDKFGGSFSYRLMRGINRLSMHAYGCAVDFDVERNGLGDPTPHFANCPLVLDAFAQEGAIWGGTWARKDGMHWQFARVG